MLGWLLRRRDPSTPPPRARHDGPVWRVAFDDAQVHLTDPSGATTSVAWGQLGYVGIITTVDRPAAPDLFWLLQQHDRQSNLVVPLGADGEHELLLAMQARLQGFDNMAVVEAMSSTDPAGFVVWQSAEKAIKA